jgi:menaquinone-dependent protoporphyrinogen oxidase
MRVLIAVASKHDATAEIGEAIGRHLRSAGLEVEVRPADDVGAVAAYDAVVIGSGVYMGKWLPAATKLIDRFQIDLRERPVWLFCSGPTGELAEAPADPACLAELEGLVNPVSHRTFGGRLEREKLGFGERLVVGMVKAPMGDFRDWEAVEGWSREIVGELVREAVEA